MEDHNLGTPVSGRSLYPQNPGVQSPNNPFNQEPVARNFRIQDPPSMDGRWFSVNQGQNSEDSGSWFNGFRLRPDSDWDVPEESLQTAMQKLNLSAPFFQPQFQAPVSPLGAANGLDALPRFSDDCPLSTDGGFYHSPNAQESLLSMRIGNAVRGLGFQPIEALASNNYDFIVPQSSLFSPSREQSLGLPMNGTASFGSHIGNGFDLNFRQPSMRINYHHHPVMPSSAHTGTRQDSNFQSWVTSHDDLRRNGFTSVPSLQQHSTLSCEELMPQFCLKTNLFSPRRRDAWEAEETRMDPGRFSWPSEDGIYGFEKLFEDEISVTLRALTGNEQKLRRICTDKAGSLFIQKFVDHIKTPVPRSLLVSALRKLTVALSNCVHGQHVFYKLFQTFSREENEPILIEVGENCVEIATDQAGCCTMQRCVDYAIGPAKQYLIAKITENALLLSQHPFGNFVVQQILGLKIENAGLGILDRLKGSFVTLSKDKFGSHVTEKCLKEFGGKHCGTVIVELVSNLDTFLNIIQDEYGNYVVQSALEASKGSIHQTLVEFIEYHSKSLESHPRGKMVLARAKGYKRPK